LAYWKVCLLWEQIFDIYKTLTSVLSGRQGGGLVIKNGKKGEGGLAALERASLSK